MDVSGIAVFTAVPAEVDSFRNSGRLRSTTVSKILPRSMKFDEIGPHSAINSIEL